MSSSPKTHRVTVFKRQQKSGNQYLYLLWRTDGKRHREALNLWLVPPVTSADKIRNSETMRMAEAIAIKKSKELDLADAGIEFHSMDPHILLADYITQSTKNKTNKDWVQGRLNMAANIKEYKPYTRVVDVNRTWFEGFVKFCYDKGHKTNTVVGRCNILKAILHQAELDNIIMRRPDFSGLCPTPEPGQRCFLSLEELRKLVATPCEERISWPFLFSCFTGLRLNDVRNLKWSDVENNTITLKQHKTKQIVRIPISANAARFMPQRTAERVFPNFPTCEAWHNEKLRKWAAEAGIQKHISFHVSRHTFGTLTFNFCNDLFAVQKLMGHTKITTTQVYAKIVDETRKKAIDSVPEL